MKKHVKWLILVWICSGCRGPVQNNAGVFFYNETRGVASLDPAFSKDQSVIWPIHQIYNTLVELDSNLNVRPSIAKSWEQSTDHLIYTFHLNNNIYFQNNPAFPDDKGRRLVASDVVYSLNRIMDPATASTGAWVFNGRIAKNGFIALNDSTFQIKLVSAFPPILGILTMEYSAIVPREVVEKYGKDFGLHPCGTGPFQLKFWEQDQALVLERNPNYWEKDKVGHRLPYLSAINISFYNNKAMEFLQFRQGRLSFINDIDPSFKDEVLHKTGHLRKEWLGKIVLQKHAYLNTAYLGILVDSNNQIVKNSPLENKYIRQAIAYGINKQELIMYLRNSIGIAAKAGFVPDGLPSDNVDSVIGYNYNPKRSLELLKKAGFPMGRGLATIVLQTAPENADIASFIAKQVNNIGIKVQVEVLQKSMLLQQTAKSASAFFIGSWIADYPDAENYMAVFYSKNPAPPNYTRYNNPHFDHLYEMSLTQNDLQQTMHLYREMDQLVINDAPVIPIYYDEVIRLCQPNVRNFHPNALNLLNLKEVYIEKKE